LIFANSLLVARDFICLRPSRFIVSSLGIRYLTIDFLAYCEYATRPSPLGWLIPTGVFSHVLTMTSHFHCYAALPQKSVLETVSTVTR
jgi:hypothetical protein